MTKPSFRVYVDESGDEGFVFNDSGRGSSRWLVLSAVVTRYEQDAVVVKLMDDVRALLERPRRQQVHFVKLSHAQKTAYAREIGKTRLRTLSVLIHKPSIEAPETFQARKHRLYRYAVRLLLERVSWLCRDHCIKDRGDGFAEIIFSNRGQMSYDDLRGYLCRLRDKHDTQIKWSAIDPTRVKAVQHAQMAGLQVADAVASSAFAAVNANQFGDTEDRYLQELLSVAYRHGGKLSGYGVKFWPTDITTLQMKDPRLRKLSRGSEIAQAPSSRIPPMRAATVASDLYKPCACLQNHSGVAPPPRQPQLVRIPTLGTSKNRNTQSAVNISCKTSIKQ